MASLVIGITGKKRSGKDTLAARLISEHDFTQVRFVDPLRALLRAQDPIVYTLHDAEGGIVEIRLNDVLSDVGDWEIAKEIPEVRRLMQATGTEGARQIFGQDFWVEQAARKVASIDGPVVITDCRFPNEADFITDVGGLLVRVNRPGLVSTDEHASETALDSRIANLVVINDGTIADLHDRADAIMRLL